MIQAKVQSAPKIEFEAGRSIYKWGKDNLFPDDLIKLVGRSGLASQCLDITARYLAGEGLVSNSDHPQLKKILDHINRDVLPEVARGFAFIPMLVTNVQHNAIGEVKKLIPVDNTSVRFMEMSGPDVFTGIATAGDWKGKNAKEMFDPKYPERYLQKFPIWKGKEQAAATYEAGLAPKGHMYYMCDFRAGDFIYPTPTWFSGGNAIYMDGQIIVWQVDNIDNNFNADFIVLARGDFSGVDENGKPQIEKFKDSLRERFSGTSDNGQKKGDRFVVLTAKNMDDPMPFEIKAIPNTGSDDMFIALYEKVHQSVTETFGVPNALVNGVQSSSLGSKELINAITLFNNGLYPQQKQIASYFQRIIKDWEGMESVEFELEIKQNQPVTEIPESVLARLDNNTIFEMYGITPAKGASKTTADILSGLSPIVANKALNEMSRNEIRTLIALPSVAGGDKISEPQGGTNGQ